MARGTSRVLLINSDDRMSRYISEKLIIEGEYSVVIETNSSAGLDTFRQNGFDVVLIKFGMPDLDTPGLIKNIKGIDPDSVIIVLLEDINAEILDDIAKMGIYGFIAKPVDFEKLFLLLQKGAELHAQAIANRRSTIILKEQNATLQKQNLLLAKRIDESTRNLSKLYEDLRTTYMRTIKALAQAIDARDHYTHSHSGNVAKCAVMIAEEMGLSAREIEVIRDAAELHDLGKIGVEDRILIKTTSLTPEEWVEMKRHPLIGAQILEPLTFMTDVVALIRQHHEHYDGTGYPDGLKGEEILLGARIIHLSDAYDSMCSSRSYRKIPFTKDEALFEINKNAGSQFDPKVAAAFLNIVDRL